MDTLPERINVMYATTYGVQEVIDRLREDNRDTKGEMEITMDDIMTYIETETLDLIRYVRLKDLIFTDENGDEL